MNFFKKLFGKNGPDFRQLVEDGAQIVDVRTAEEFSGGHIFKAINIPLQDLNEKAHQLDKNHPVITCCASGVRSASAVSVLKNNGFIVYDGGGWQSLQKEISN